MRLNELVEAFYASLSYTSCMTVVLANSCTLACFFTNTTFPMRLDLIGIAVVFPLVFSINGAFQRREQALQHLARMKANAFSIRFAFHHWMEGAFLSTDGPDEIDKVLHFTFARIAKYFKSDEFSEYDYVKITSQFAVISWLIEIHLRRGGVPPPNISRVNESLRALMADFELLRNLKNYRTPLALRAYTKIFILFFPILFAPLFAALAIESGLWGALITATLFSLILAGFNNIQDGLEEPFDGVGIDDVSFDQYIRHMRFPIVTPAHREYDFSMVKSEDDIETPTPSLYLRNCDSGDQYLEVKIECNEEVDLGDVYTNADSRPASTRRSAPMMNRK